MILFTSACYGLEMFASDDNMFILLYSLIFLQKGDVVECEIDEIGTIRNTIQ